MGCRNGNNQYPDNVKGKGLKYPSGLAESTDFRGSLRLTSPLVPWQPLSFKIVPTPLIIH